MLEMDSGGWEGCVETLEPSVSSHQTSCRFWPIRFNLRQMLAMLHRCRSSPHRKRAQAVSPHVRHSQKHRAVELTQLA
jgi:hypothetical protein